MLDSFQQVGVNSSKRVALYKNISSSSFLSLSCLSTVGLSPSGPGDFLFLNSLKTSLSLSTDSHLISLSKISLVSLLDSV